MDHLLISLPNERDSIHGRRAWTITSALAEAAAVRISQDPRDWSIDDVWAGVVFNGPNDLDQLLKLRAAGRPSLYFGTFGPVSEGRLLDTVLQRSDHTLSTRLKMQTASAVHADTFAQALAAQGHYGLTPCWIVSPPAVRSAASPVCPGDKVAAHVRQLYVAGSVCEDVSNALNVWCDAQGWLAPYSGTEGDLPGRLADRVGDALVVCLGSPFYGDALLETLGYGVPAVVWSTGVVEPLSVLAEWVIAPTADLVLPALERAARWTPQQTWLQAQEVSRYTWDRKCASILAMLRRLRCTSA
jgi:hypothetical protein